MSPSDAAEQHLVSCLAAVLPWQAGAAGCFYGKGDGGLLKSRRPYGEDPLKQ